MYACCVKALQVLVDATLLPGGYKDLESRGMRVSSGSCPNLTYTQNSIVWELCTSGIWTPPKFCANSFSSPKDPLLTLQTASLHCTLPIFKHFEERQCLCQKAQGFTVTNYASMQKPFPPSEISLLWFYITTDCTSVAALTHFMAPAVLITGF